MMENEKIVKNEKPTVIAVVGPTASGKTELAIELASRLTGEIISCDSMQLYRGMDVGTAKPTAEEQAAAPHHMIDVADPWEDFSCARYADMASAVLEDVLSRGKTPIFCGGTGLYLDSVLYGTRFSESRRDEAYCRSLDGRDDASLHAELAEIDPASAAAIHPNNRRRVIRALEIYHATGTPKSEWDARSRERESPYDLRLIGLDYADRTILADRIDRRVDGMLEQGLIEEVTRLAPRLSDTAAQAIGYKEILAYLGGALTREQAAEQIKIGTRQYAKRQRTWFYRDPAVHWLYADRMSREERIEAALRIATGDGAE